MNGYRRSAHMEKASTGNDLVFLPATRPERTCLPRFYSRILTAAEVTGFQRVAPYGLPFDRYVWLCWSIKESAYKYQKRLHPELSFAPLRFEVSRLEPPLGGTDHYTGIARISAATTPTLYSRSLIRDGVIVTVVSKDSHFTNTHWGFSTIDSPGYAKQSAAVRKLALTALSTVLAREDLQLHKDAAGCPIVVAGDRPLAIPLSLAHHDRYIAYAFLNKVV
jgi:hypothetical protein